MEPVAHYGIRKEEKNFKITVKWTDGSYKTFQVKDLNQEIKVKQE